jgi:hypothetical protein
MYRDQCSGVLDILGIAGTLRALIVALRSQKLSDYHSRDRYAL